MRSSRVTTVLTHAYEGGTSDHDGVARCVQPTTRLLSSDAPTIIEMPYTKRRGASESLRLMRGSEMCPLRVTTPPRSTAQETRRVTENCLACYTAGLPGRSKTGWLRQAISRFLRNTHPISLIGWLVCTCARCGQCMVKCMGRSLAAAGEAARALVRVGLCGHASLPGLTPSRSIGCMAIHQPASRREPIGAALETNRTCDWRAHTLVSVYRGIGKRVSHGSAFKTAEN